MNEHCNSQNNNLEEAKKLSDETKKFSDETQRLSEDMIEAFEQHLDDGVSIINPSRCKVFAGVYKILSDHLRGNGIKMSYALCEPLSNMAYILVTGPSIRFDNTEMVVDALRSADVVEVYVKTDGRVELEVTFYGITVSAKK